MTVRVTKETQPRVVLKGANSGSVNSGVLSGSGDGVRVSMTFTATAEPLIVIPYGNVAEAQLEEGSFATSYIPTSGSQSTRSPDIASIPVSAFGYNQDAGTVVIESQLLTNPLTTQIPVFLGEDSGATTSDSMLFFSDGVFRVRESSGSTLASIDAGTFLTSTMVKAAFSYKTDDFAACIDGGSVVIDTSGDINDVSVSQLSLSSNPAGVVLGQHIKSIQYYPRRLTDAQLQELTA
jgi:hypothetical protein